MTVAADTRYLRLALRLARRAYGRTSPNPLVGAVLVKGDRILGRGWHHQAGQPHAEIEALLDAARRGHSPRGATLYVNLEPCCTHGRTPPCTDAILAAGIRRVVAAGADPNPAHRGRGFRRLRRAGVEVVTGLLSNEAAPLNEAFFHWIRHRTPLVTLKAAMTLDGRIATDRGESKWITGELARRHGMKLREGADAILVGINTILADNPSLTWRASERDEADDTTSKATTPKNLKRIVLDSHARTPLDSRVVCDSWARFTTIVTTRLAPRRRRLALSRRVRVWVAPSKLGRVDLDWLLGRLGEDSVVSLLVEGGGEVNASFLWPRRAHRVAFFYAPKIIGGRGAPRAVAGDGAKRWDEILTLQDPEWRRLGEDLFLSAGLTDRGKP